MSPIISKAVLLTPTAAIFRFSFRRIDSWLLVVMKDFLAKGLEGIFTSLKKSPIGRKLEPLENRFRTL